MMTEVFLEIGMKRGLFLRIVRSIKLGLLVIRVEAYQF
jgi:hypothetical protein